MAASPTGAAVILVCGDNAGALLLACMMAQRHCVRAWVGDGLAAQLEPLLKPKHKSKDVARQRIGFLDSTGKPTSVEVLVGEEAAAHGTQRTPSLSLQVMATAANEKDAARKQGAGRNTVSYVVIVLCMLALP
jgi:hypothetical protein